MHDKIIRLKIRIANWLNRNGKYCWADCVSWAYSKSCNPFKISDGSGCQHESATAPHESCYCGQFYKGKCWQKMTREAQIAAQEPGRILNSPALNGGG